MLVIERQWIASTLHLKEAYAQTLLIHKTDVCFPVTARDCLLQTEHNDFVQTYGKILRYGILVNCSEECTIWISFRSHHYVFYSDADKVKLCSMIEMKYVTLP